MPVELTPAQPWVKGQILTDADGFEYEAQGSNFAKPHCVPVVVTGEAGPPGVAGPDGTNGTNGTNGKNGTNGTNGTNGITPDCGDCIGLPGDKGQPGELGDKGPDGTVGADGTDGTNGTDGVNGTDGSNGTNGVNGLNGANGLNGIDGIDGTNGTDGVDASIDCEKTAKGELTYTFTDVGGTETKKQTCPCNEPAVSITKSCDPAGPAGVGDVIQYSFEVCNSGTEALVNVNVNDDVLGVIVLGAGIPVGTCQTFTKDYTVTAADLGAGEVSNTATVDADGFESGQSVTSQDAHTVPVVAPAVTIVKSCDPAGPAELGDVIEYSFEVCNTGTEPLVNLAVSDDVLGLIISGQGMEPGTCATYTQNYTVTAADVAAGTVDNTATVNAVGFFTGGAVSAEDSHSLEVEGEECVQRTVCGKVTAPLFDVTRPAYTSTDHPNGVMTFVSNGVTVTFDYTGGTNPGGAAIPDGCVLLSNASGNSFAVTVSGLDALACDGCLPCLELEPEIGSMDAGTTFTPDAVYDVVFLQNTSQAGNVFTGQGAGDGEVVFGTTATADGQAFAGTFGGAQDNTRMCLHRWALQIPVKIVEESCDGGATWDFISATDCNGATYAASEITLG